MKHNIKFDNTQLNNFAITEWNKVLIFLGKSFGLSHDDCQDVFQDSFITLYQNISDNKLANLTCSLSTYFMSICKNKAHEVLRKNSKVAVDEDDIPLSLIDDNFKEDKINALISYDNNDFEEEKEKLVSEIVQNLPSPCDELLWGFYRDELSMKTLAQKLNYSEGSIKVIKYRCCEKFRIRYQELANNLF